MKRFLNGLYNFLLLSGFLMLVLYLPRELDNFFSINFFNKYPLISSILIIVILFLGYKAKEDIEDENKREKSNMNYHRLTSTIKLVNYLNNYNYKDLKIIQYAYYNELNDFHILIKNTDIKIMDNFVKEDLLFNIDLKILDECLQNYTDKLENFNVSMYIKDNYKIEESI